MSSDEVEDPLLDDGRCAHRQSQTGISWQVIAQHLHCTVSHAQRLAAYYRERTDTIAPRGSVKVLV